MCKPRVEERKEPGTFDLREENRRLRYELKRAIETADSAPDLKRMYEKGLQDGGKEVERLKAEIRRLSTERIRLLKLHRDACEDELCDECHGPG